MNAQDNNLDQIFRDAAQSQKAPLYDDAYWAEMNAMLDARSKKKKGFIYWTLGGTAAAIGLLILLFGINNQKATALYTQNELQNKQIERIAESTTNTANTENTAKETVKTKNTNSQTKKNSNNATVKTERSTYNLKGNQNSQASTATNTVHTNSKSNKNIIQGENEEIGKNVVGKENLENKKDAELYIQEDKTEEIALSEIEMLPIIERSLVEQYGTERLRFIDHKYNPATRINLYAKLSGGVMENYKTSRPFESGLVDFSINAEINIKNLLVRSGLGIQMTSNADLIVSQRAKVYDFGATDIQNDLSYQTLYDLYLPVEFGYKYKSTSFGIGIQINYLMSTKMDLNRYENTNLVTTEKLYGNTNGLNRFSTQGYLWLEHGITNRFSLGLKVGTNISGRIKEGKYFNNSATTNPIYGQISLRYNLLK